MEDAGETAVFLLLPEMVSLAMLRFVVDAVPSIEISMAEKSHCHVCTEMGV